MTTPEIITWIFITVVLPFLFGLFAPEDKLTKTWIGSVITVYLLFIARFASLITENGWLAFILRLAFIALWITPWYLIPIGLRKVFIWNPRRKRELDELRKKQK
jgi:hypothetical protein